MNERFRGVLPLVSWVAVLGAAIVAFTAMGSGQLAGPPMDPGAWAGWADARDPVVATVALLRLVVLGLAWYLAAVTLVGALARVARLTTMVRFTDALTLPIVRRVLQTSLGVGLATAVVVSSTTAPVPRSRSTPVLAATTATEVERDAPTMRPLPPRVAPVPLDPADDPAPSRTTEPAPSTATDPAVDTPPPFPDPTPSGGRGDPRAVPAPGASPPADATEPPAPDAVDRRPGPEAATGHAPRDGVADHSVAPERPGDRPVTRDRPTSQRGGDPSPDGSTPLPTAGEASAATVTVRPGDHLWSIAEHHLAEVHGRGVTDDEVTPYWRRLVERNRDRLVDPANPDLILPGQQFVLPDVEVVP